MTESAPGEPATGLDKPPLPLDKSDARKWFRPSDVLVGADGAVYVSDFYDPYIGGHRMLEPNGHSTIYRITRVGDNPQAPQLNSDTPWSDKANRTCSSKNRCG